MLNTSKSFCNALILSAQHPCELLEYLRFERNWEAF